MAEDPEDDFKVGDFPFPITDGPTESPYLVWIRNHSNYMAVRGLSDYMRAVGVLIRGILINFVIFVPYLLVVSLFVAASNLLQQPPPYLFTKILLGLFVAWILLFPLLTPIFRIVEFEKSRATGSDSSVKQRDRYERSFGGFLIAILAAAALESLPGLLDDFHGLVYESDFGWPTLAFAIAAASVVFSMAPKLLAAFGGKVAKSLTLVVVGALGLLVPLLFILYVSDFLVFGRFVDLTEFTGRAGGILLAGVSIVVAVGVILRAFKWKDIVSICMLLVLSLGVLGLGIAADKFVLSSFIDKIAPLRDATTVELRTHPEMLEKLTVDSVERPGPRLAALNTELADYRRYIIHKQDFFDNWSISFPEYPKQSEVSKTPIERMQEYSDNLNEVLQAYRQYRDEKVEFYELDLDSNPSLQKQLEELRDELLEVLGNEARNTEGLSPLVELVNAIENARAVEEWEDLDDYDFEESTKLIDEIHRLYTRTAALRSLYGPQPIAELVATLVSIPNKIIESLDVEHDYRLLKKEFAEFEGARHSLESWGIRLKAARRELAGYGLDRQSREFFELIESGATVPGPSLASLREELYREDARQKYYVFSEQSVNTNQHFGKLLEGLLNVGYNVWVLYPSVGELVEAINKKHPADISDALTKEVERLYSRAVILRDINKPQSLRDLSASLISIPDEDIEKLNGEYWEPKNPVNDSDEEGHSQYPELSQLNGFDEAENQLDIAADYFYWYRDELIDTASLLLSDSAIYAAPVAERLRTNTFWPKFILVSIIAVQLWFISWLAADINLTSIHGMYRDRLASAFLVGKGTKGDVGIERDLDLMEICRREEGSVAPYHLINVALNLQGSKHIGVRDRQSDFFIFSKNFIGGERTRYCRSESMERVFPQMDLATAMAISAAAASPNMGRGTSPALVAIMTLLNVRLGFWVPNPKRVEKWLAEIQGTPKAKGKLPGFSFDEVFQKESQEIEIRWPQVPGSTNRQLVRNKETGQVVQQTSEHLLFGIGYSGGGIRSATVNLGMTQVFQQRGVFVHADYMSTVSGGGYLGSSISALMRRKPGAVGHTPPVKPVNTADNEVETGMSVGELFKWRVRPIALWREILGRLDEDHRWVNLSDGGHIENLAGIELLRRRCKYIIIGDGEADPNHHFNGLATLIRTARIDLGTDIDINVMSLRLGNRDLCRRHWAMGRIKYPGEDKRGYLLYLKSSITGDEDEVIQQYRNTSPSFPHESTADQFFSEGQFEAYRSLGQHMAEQLFKISEIPVSSVGTTLFGDVEKWFETLWEHRSDAKSDTENA